MDVASFNITPATPDWMKALYKNIVGLPVNEEVGGSSSARCDAVDRRTHDKRDTRAVASPSL